MLKPIVKEPDKAGHARTPSSTRWALASLSLSMLMPSLGISIANIALPTLAQAFGASFQQAQWIVLAYLLAITTLIVSVGRLGDIFGRRRLLLTGTSLFTLASLFCGIAPTLSLLLAARAFQGLGAAMMMALAVAMVGETVPKEKTGSAMGLLGTMSAIGTTLGPSLGGILIAGFGWKAIFLINVPLGIANVLLAARFLPADRPNAKTTQGRPDAIGTLLLALTLAAYALAMTMGRGSFGGSKYRPAAGHSNRNGAVSACASQGEIAAAAPFHVPRFGADGRPCHEHIGLDRDDGDAGGRPLLPFFRTRLRCS